MRPLTRTIFVLLSLAAAASAQLPAVRYIQPDIGAPGMPTIVEFIAPSSSPFNTFGPDSLNPPNVKVLTYSNDVIPGPKIISNNGRVLDVMLFVLPSAAGSANLTVQVDSAKSGLSPQFFVSGLQHVGALSGGGTIGFRSARGAMVVDSIVLTSGTFTLDMIDHDNNELGNQSFLPAVILSQGPIKINSGATLNLGATWRDAGPGGGGGGGRACDYTNPANPGGSGYTGGGGGGTNSSSGSKSYQGSGVGSGPSSQSLNNAKAGEGGFGCATNGGAGGTGFPFGSGGVLWCSGGAPAGDVGGGSSGRDGYGGGGGAYSTPGGSGDAPNGGLIYGDPTVVPLCGGSGGAAGNPNVPALIAS